jgi:hypothetical protein
MKEEKMEQHEITLLLAKYNQAKSDYEEVIHRAENKRTAGQIIRAEERYKCLQEVCANLGIVN